MTEEIQTRTEHSRSLEDAAKYQAIETLKELGLLVPVADIETYHGRIARSEDEGEWKIDPAFANGGNDSGNSNANERPTLYTGDQATAQEFADERAGFPRKYLGHLQQKVKQYTPEENIGRLERQNAHLKKLWEEKVDEGSADPETSAPEVWTLDELLSKENWVEARYLKDALGQDAYQEFKNQFSDQLSAEVHDIVSSDIDATVLDFAFDSTKLSEDDQQRYQEALKALAIRITEGSPVGFEDREAVEAFAGVVNKFKKRMILQEDVEELAAEAGISEEVALQLTSAYNTRQIALRKPGYLAHLLISNSKDVITADVIVDGEHQDVPINLEYVQRYLREAHIVGVRQSIASATLDRDITSVSFFDLEKVSTAPGLIAERQATWKKLGGMASVLGEIARPEVIQTQPLLNLLEDVHAKPDKLVEAAKSVEGYSEVFDADTGVWEGFTLGEHTETVLRNFEENYADRLPVELLTPMRLAIIAHDLGKPTAVLQGDMRKQKEYNVTQAGDFLTKLGVDDRLKNLLVAMIGDGEELAFRIDVRKAGEPAMKSMIELSVRTLKDFYGTEDVTDEQINSFIEMCKILQICDGGAYTSMAVTRRADGKGQHRNSPSFNASFAQPIGFGKRDIRLKEDEEESASSNLTPLADAQQSKLRISRRGAGRKAPTI